MNKTLFGKFSNNLATYEGLEDKQKGKCEDSSKKLKPNNSYELTFFIFIIFAIIVSATFGAWLGKRIY